MSVVLALALGVSSGLNPYVTVAITSIVAARSDLLTPGPAFTFVASTGMFVGALLLLPIDIFADKFPGSGGLMDRVGWLLRPIAGGIVGGAALATGGPGVILGVALGAGAALATHALRLRTRRRVQWRMLGFGRIVFGAYGDFGSGIVAMIALLTPPLGLAIAASLLVAALLVDRRWGGEAPSAESQEAVERSR